MLRKKIVFICSQIKENNFAQFKQVYGTKYKEFKEIFYFLLTKGLLLIFFHTQFDSFCIFQLNSNSQTWPTLPNDDSNDYYNFTLK